MNIVMTSGRTLLQPFKTIKVTKKVSVSDDKANEGKDPRKDIMETKLVNKKVPANFQLAEVVATGPKQIEYKVGDTVVFKPNFSITLDIVKEVILVNDFDIIGVYKNNVE